VTNRNSLDGFGLVARFGLISGVVGSLHITTIFQALDPILFVTLKKLKQTAIGYFGDDSTNDQFTNHTSMMI
jgi:hypothetical protein